MYLHDNYLWQSKLQGNTYKHWIEMNYPDKESCINRCNDAVQAMINYFDNLTVQVGFANRVYHCWCKGYWYLGCR